MDLLQQFIITTVVGGGST